MSSGNSGRAVERRSRRLSQAGRPRPSLVALLALIAALVVVACGNGGTLERGGAGGGATSDGVASSTTVWTPPPTTAPLSPLASLVTPAGSAIHDPATVAPLPVPVRIDVDGVGVTGAPVVAVGVNSAGEFEVPGVREVGWYRFGSRPGDTGSAVLAAHIAYNGVDGVFRRLARVREGAGVRVGFSDGTTRSFVVTEVARYAKDALPDDVFAKTGEPRLVLISCGGTFNRELRSYDDNIVAYAVPVP